MASRMNSQNPETFANLRDAFQRGGPQDPASGGGGGGAGGGNIGDQPPQSQ